MTIEFLLAAAIAVTSLQTEYRTEPVGIETPKPRFSWKMESSRKGAAQSAYQIAVTAPDGIEVWNSGKVESSASVAVPYEGEKLLPNSVYRWSVTVWDEKGKQLREEKSSFTTGLMGSGWSGAEWIGSSQPHFSKYRSFFDLSVKFTGEEAKFFVNKTDDDNYVLISVRGGRLIVSHRRAGVSVEDGNYPMAFALMEKNSMNISYRSESYRRGTALDIAVNNRTVARNVRVDYDEKASVGEGYSRIYGVGYAAGETEYSDIIIKDGTWGKVLYRASGPFKASEGERFWVPAEETGAPMLRTDIYLSGEPVYAVLYSTARGICNFFINGGKADDGYFSPGSTDYNKSIAYLATDVTGLLHKGKNGVGAILGSGWWTDAAGYKAAWQDQYGIEKSMMAKIEVTYEDGTTDVFVTDGSWKVYDGGPITSDSLYNGEDYDARREVPGWADEGFDASSWDYVTVYDRPARGIAVKPYVGDPVRCALTLTAQSVAEPRPGVFVYDMGQNMVGVPSITVKGAEGTQLTIYYGEMIYPEQLPEDPVKPMTVADYEARRGLVYHENYRSALSTDHYICKGDPDGETFSPLLTFHGYRYVQIEGLDEALPVDCVKGLVLNSIGTTTSTFETSDANINRLFSNIQWSQMGNFVSIPTDCPQRDERLGWTGDAQIFARTSTYNANVDPFFTRWAETLRETQMPDGSYPAFTPNLSDHETYSMGWMEVGIVLPWQIFQQYGDLLFVERQWDSMERYFRYLERRAANDIQPGGGYGDWLALELTNTPLTNTAYYAYDAMLMSKMASALGKADAAAYYGAKYQAIKEAFNREFVGKGGYTKESRSVPRDNDKVASGETVRRKFGTQTSYIVPLMTDLFNEENRPLAEQHLLEEIEKTGYTLTTGFIGTPYINLVLSAAGHSDVAWKLFEQTEYPSWLYPVLQGATSIWERWNSYTIKRGFGPVSMNSFNHYSYGAIEDWMMSCALGIERDEENPGYRHFFLRPCPGGSLEYARGSFESPYGRIEAGWKRSGNGYIYEVTVPANTTATLEINSEKQELKSGRYTFRIR